MQYTFLLSLLAVTGAIAAPARSDSEIRVSLSDQQETGAQVVFHKLVRSEASPATDGPFSQVTLNLGKDVAKQNLRCQILNHAGKPITVTRGANVDITFGDGGKGPWSFPSTKVSRVVCDPAFKQRPPPAAPRGSKPPVRVILEDQQTETGSQTELPFGRRVKRQPVGTFGPFSTVELNVGDDSEQALRCQILNKHGRPITVTRGANVDITFSDADKGPWSFTTTEVSTIICDPRFKSANA